MKKQQKNSNISQPSQIDSDEGESSCWSCLFKKKKQPLIHIESLQQQQPPLRNQSSHYQSIQEQVEQQTIYTPPQKQEVFHQIAETPIIKPKILKRDFPLNRVFFLPTKSSKHAILAKITENKFNNLAKITEKHLKVQPDQKNVEDTFKTTTYNFSTTIDKRIKLEIIEKDKPLIEYISSITLAEATPEDIAKYIAKRVSGTSILIDIGCGVGYNTAHFAQECELTIGIEINKENVNIANHYCSQIYKCMDKVDFIQADCCVAMKRLKAELIFVNPSVRDESNIDLFKDTTPDLRQLIENSLDIAPNLIILLPKNIDFQQIASMFYTYFKRSNNIHPYDYLYAIEIESIVIEQSIEYYIVYFGNKSSLKKIEIHEFLAQTLYSQGSVYKGTNFNPKLKNIINQVEQAVGKQRDFQIIFLKGPFQLASLVYQLQTHPSPFTSILGQFLSELYQKNLIDEAIMNRISQSSTNEKQSTQEYLDNKKFHKLKQPHLISFQSNPDFDQSAPIIGVTSQAYKRSLKQTPYDEKLISPNEFSLKDQEFESHPFGINVDLYYEDMTKNFDSSDSDSFEEVKNKFQ